MNKKDSQLNIVNNNTGSENFLMLTSLTIQSVNKTTYTHIIYLYHHMLINICSSVALHTLAHVG